MKRRECPQCELRFKSKPRRLAASDTRAVTCPRCGHIIEVNDEWDLPQNLSFPSIYDVRRR